jgi:hypothetical protein
MKAKCFGGHIQAFQAMFVGKNDLEKKLRKRYVGDYLAQIYFIKLCNKKESEKNHFLDGLFKWK